MMAQKFLKYLTTDKGRIFTMNSVCFTGIVMFGANYLPNTIFISQFKEFVQAYKQGDERQVPEKLQQRFEYAMELCKCTEFEKKFLQPFVVYGFDTTHLGTVKSRFGGYIGLPTNYFYDKQSDIDRGNLLVRGEPIKWSSEDGVALQESLVLTEAEQVFGIARSILQIKTHKLLIMSLYPPVCLFSMYATGHYLNQKMNLYAKPLAIRLGLYTMLGIFGFGLYAFLTDYTQVYYDTSVDKKLAEIGPVLTNAGVSFYDKLLKKNVALRNMTGENTYTAKGNENYFLRMKSLPITIRKSFFEMKKYEQEQGNIDESVS